MMLADLGARVIKIETPDSGDDSRGWGPPFLGEGAERESSYFMAANCDKESITLDLKTSADRDVLTAMILRADVLIADLLAGAGAWSLGRSPRVDSAVRNFHHGDEPGPGGLRL